MKRIILFFSVCGLLFSISIFSFQLTSFAESVNSDVVKIAVIDTGLELSEYDNLVDIVHEYDFINNSTDLSDGNGHGTHISNIVSSCGNCLIMPLKVLNSSGRGINSDVSEAIIYAVDNGADLINMSFGGFSHSEKLLEAVNYANENGVVLLASKLARNDLEMYPAAYPNVIGVVVSDDSQKNASIETANVTVAVSKILSSDPSLNNPQIIEKLHEYYEYEGVQVVLNDKSELLYPDSHDDGLVSVQYSSDVHEYLTDEALKFLKTKNPEAYEEMQFYLYDLREGAFDEDAVGPNISPVIIDTSWRPLRHFYRITDGLGYFNGGSFNISTAIPDLVKEMPNIKAEVRYPNAYEWASGNDDLNKHDFEDALAAYARGDKKEAYYTLGFTLHLIEDMSLPEHTHLESHNDDPFPTGGLEDGSGYEQYIADQYSTVYEDDCNENKLRNYLHPFCEPPGDEDPFHAVSVMPVFSYYDDVLSDYTNLKQYFDSMATFGYYRNRFRANLDSETKVATGELARMFPIKYDDRFYILPNTWILFPDYASWNGDRLVSVADSWWETAKFDGNPDESGWYYIENSYNKLDLGGKIRPAIYKKDWYSYAAGEMKKHSSDRFKTPYSGNYVRNVDDKVLADVMADDLVPLAVQHAAGIMDLFWRETRQPEEARLTLEIDGIALEMPSYTDFGDVAVGGSKTITFTVRNTAEGVLFVSPNPRFTAGDIDQFEIVSVPTESYLGAGESTTFQVKFKPDSSGYKIVGMNLETSDDYAVFNVEGTGVENVVENEVDEIIADETVGVSYVQNYSETGLDELGVEDSFEVSHYVNSVPPSCDAMRNGGRDYIEFEITDENKLYGDIDFGLTHIDYTEYFTVLVDNNSSGTVDLIPRYADQGKYVDFEVRNILAEIHLGDGLLIAVGGGGFSMEPGDCTSFVVSFNGWSDYLDSHIAIYGDGGNLDKGRLEIYGHNIFFWGDHYSYTVAPGETLSSIAARFGISESTILEDSLINNAEDVKVGKNLIIDKDLIGTVDSSDVVELVEEEEDEEIVIEESVQDNELVGRGFVSCDDFEARSDNLVYDDLNEYKGGGGHDFGLLLLGKTLSETLTLVNCTSQTMTMSPLYEAAFWDEDTFIYGIGIKYFELGINSNDVILESGEYISFDLVFTPESLGDFGVFFEVYVNGELVDYVNSFATGVGIEGDYYLYKADRGDTYEWIYAVFGMGGLLIPEEKDIAIINGPLFDGMIVKIPKDLVGKSYPYDGDLSLEILSDTTNHLAETFSDTTNHWAESFIDELYERGVVNGKEDGVFDPNASITRAELAKMAVEAGVLTGGLNFYENISSSSFADVSVNEWYAPYVEAAYNAEIIEGTEIGGKRYFRPNEPVSRVEALKILLYANGFADYTNDHDTQIFTDVPRGEWYSSIVEYAKDFEIVTGYPDGSFRPANEVTRAEAAKILYVLFFED